MKSVFQKKRLILGLIVLAVELWLLLGSGVLRERASHFLTGEGAWDCEFSAECPLVVQEFKPVYSELQSIAFCLDTTAMVHGDGSVELSVLDEKKEPIYVKKLPIYEVVNSAYTDVDLGLKLQPGKTYYLQLLVQSGFEEEWPTIWVCSKEYALQESGELLAGEILSGQHLVSKYVYANALPKKSVRNAIIVAVLTALGVCLKLPDKKYLRQIISVVFLLVTPYILGSRLESLTYDVAFYLPFAMRWNVGIMYGLELVALLITHSTVVATVVVNTLLTVLYSANYFMRIYRGTSLRLNDFTAIGTATKVMGEYDFRPNSHMAFTWAILVLVIVWSLGCLRKPHHTEGQRSKKTWVLFGVSYGVSIALAVGILGFFGHRFLYTDYFDEVGFVNKGIRGFEYELIYAFDGYLVASFIEINNSRIEPPKDYSVQQVEEVLQQAKNAEECKREGMSIEADKPHIILIMNESLADLTILDGVELNQDNMPFLRSMKENTVKGFTNASVFGGGTANSEFEVFTGCTMAFCSVNYYPYQQAIKKPMPSMVSQLKNQGYTTIAMHPERPNNWNRDKIYQYFSFEQRYFQADFENAPQIHSGVSDAATYEKIIDLYEHREADEKLFVFDLTMQNHGGYNIDGGPYAVKALNVSEPQVDEYLSLVKISDAAFADLIAYFENADEKVIICMYGDHQPFVSDYLILEDSQEAKKYKTPFVIWANYDIEETEGMDLSMNYLGGLIMRTAGLPLSPYFAYLENMREQYPIITPNGYVDSNGVYESFSGEDTEFSEYRMLQFNYLYDDNQVEWGY